MVSPNGFQVVTYLVSNLIFQYDQQGAINYSDNDAKDSYDFIVIGGGTAGSVVASRLSEVRDFKVLVLEAGGAGSAYSDVAFISNFDFANTSAWLNYESTPQEEICQHEPEGRCHGLSYGNILGGGSTVNPGNYIRSTKVDYDRWAEAGAKGWSWNDVLPYLRKSETYHPEPGETFNPITRGRHGPIQITRQQAFPMLRQLFLNISRDRGFELRLSDDDGIPGDVAFDFQLNQFNGIRSNTRRAYLEPVMHQRSNLKVVCFARATKINFDGKTAVSVEYERFGRKKTIKVGKEVILSAGAIESPKLLLLSGVGDAGELAKFNIPIVHDLPGVGKQMNDHVLFDIYYDADKLYLDEADVQDLRLYNQTHKRGLFASFNRLNMQLFTVTGNQSDINIQLEFGFKEQRNGSHFPISDDEFKAKKSQIQIHIKWLSPKSEGTVTLASTDPYKQPNIDGRWLTVESDFIGLRRGIRRALEFFEDHRWKQINLKLVPFDAPVCEASLGQFGLKSDEYIDCIIHQLAISDTHFCRTCRMGHPKDPMAVLDPELKIIGLNQIRVIDTSSIPVITRGNTVGPAVVIAEKGSDMIKKTYRQSTRSPVLSTPYNTRI